MSGTSRVGFVLLGILALWVVLYYQLFVPIAQSESGDESGLVMRETDSIATVPEGSEPERDPVETQQPNTGDSTADPGEDETDDGVEQEAETDVPDPDRSVIPPPPPTTEYIVQQNDTMESIAQNWFGAKSKWVLIAHENPYVDPAHMTAGQKLRLPPRAARLEDIPPEEFARLTKITRYIVAPNDSLWKIAAKFYGKGTLYQIIADANKELLGGGIDVREGMELVIPPYQRPAD